MPRTVRLDVGDLGSVEKTPSGGLRIPASIARTGVLRYRDLAGREWGELVPPDVLFDTESMAGLRGAPVTDLHPKTDTGLVTPETWKELAKGHAGDDVRRNGDLLDVSVLVQDAGEVHLVEAGERSEVSAGYECEVEPEQGDWNGEHYDVVQRLRRYNHLALGPPGFARAGAQASLRMDGAAVQVRLDRKGVTMKTIKIGGRIFRFDEGDLPGIEAAIAALEGQIASLGPQNEAASQQLDALKDMLGTSLAKVQELEKRLATGGKGPDAATPGTDNTAPAAITEDSVPCAVKDAIAEKRLALWDRAAALGVKREDCRGKTERQVYELAIRQRLPAVKQDSLTASNADVVRGMFEALAQSPAPRNDALAATARAAAGVSEDGRPLGTGDATRSDGAELDADAAERRMRERTQKMSHRPIGQ